MILSLLLMVLTSNVLIRAHIERRSDNLKAAMLILVEQAIHAFVMKRTNCERYGFHSTVFDTLGVIVFLRSKPY